MAASGLYFGGWPGSWVGRFASFSDVMSDFFLYLQRDSSKLYT
jgi:hypothetical protein